MIKIIKLTLGIILVVFGCFFSVVSSQFMRAGSGTFVEPNTFFLGLTILITGSIVILYDFRKSKNILFIAIPIILVFVLVISNAVYVTYFLDDGYNPMDHTPIIRFAEENESAGGWYNYTLSGMEFTGHIKWDYIEIIPYFETGERIEDFNWTYISDYDYESVCEDDKLCIQVDSCDHICVVWKPTDNIIAELNCNNIGG